MAESKLTDEQREQAKDDFVAYFKDVPVQKYAAMYVGVSEQTIITWLKTDKTFFNRVNQARSQWVKGQMVKTRAEFALERLEKDIFKESKELEVTLPKPILGGIANALRSNDSSTEATETPEQD